MTMLEMKRNLTYWLLAAALLISLHAGAQPGKIRVACIGNSVTYGYGLAYREQNCYPARLQISLGDQYLVKNFGHSGATLLRKGHNPYDKTDELAAAIAFKPDIAIIHLGLNDTDPRDWPDHRLDFPADYAWLIEQVRKANSAVKIYICRLTPVFSGHPRFKSGTRDWYDQIQALIPQIAAANHTGLIDLHTPLYGRPDLFADNLHPNNEGAAIIARTIQQTLTQNFGGLKLPEVFADHAVLQRNRPIPIYGKANGGDYIKIHFAGHQLTTITDNTGQWSVTFPAMPAGGPYQLEIKDNGTSITLKDILIGDVWLCSGQSNMAFPLIKSVGAEQELRHAGQNKQIRLYKLRVLKETDRVEWDTAALNKVNRLHYFSGAWHQSDSVTAASFSAVGWYFGQKLFSEEHIPIGLIQVAVGGSPIESWIDRFTMEHDNLLVDELSNWRKSDFLMKFCRDRADTNLMLASSRGQRHPYEPCYNYEAGISRLIQFPVKGVIWYQGESNAHNADLYKYVFPMLVKSWRQGWGYELPFYFVQLSAIDRPSWPVFRNMERALQKQVPHCHFVVSTDVGDSLNVHYTRKKPVGERLALQALHYTYRKPIIADSPVALYAVRKGNKIIVAFSKGQLLTTIDQSALKGFELVNQKGQRRVADGAIKSNRVVLTIPAGENIKSVWYAMQPFTRANLINQAGLPASTFAIDVSNKSNE
jgi:sialate O-acetylesterase